MPSVTIRWMSANGKGFSNAAFTMLNSAVAAAIPTARETTAVAAKPGLRRKIRSAYRRSAAKVSSMKFPRRRARKDRRIRHMRRMITAILGLCAAVLAIDARAEVTVMAVRLGASDVVALARFYDAAFGLKEIDRVGNPATEIIMRFGATVAEA